VINVLGICHHPVGVAIQQGPSATGQAKVAGTGFDFVALPVQAMAIQSIAEGGGVEPGSALHVGVCQGGSFLKAGLIISACVRNPHPSLG
jgi:hypothetical protein